MDIIGIPVQTSFIVVDDVEAIRKFSVQELSNLQFSGPVFEAASGNEAFDILNNQAKNGTRIDFVISDFMMKNGSGLDLLKKIRSDSKFTNLPFLLLTTESEKELVLSCIKAGVSNYLLKPWQPTDFHQKLTFCWQKHHKIK